LNAFGSLRSHWPEYLMEASESASYMLLVCSFAALLLHPVSPVSHLIHRGLYRRALMGLLVGSAVVAIVLTPWGKQSGGHFNPVITLTFYRLGKLSFWDMLFYVISQFMGAIIGVSLAAYILRDALKNPSVHYAATTPGIFGNVGAFTGELAISYILMTAILVASNCKTLARFTPYLVGALYTAFITFESPLSGMSMNPARTLGSAFRAGWWQGFWIYLLAPTLGMLIGAEVFLWARGGIGPYCGKLDHDGDKRCIFRHGYSRREPKILISRRNKHKWKVV
jgi:aquaporin Z